MSSVSVGSNRSIQIARQTGPKVVPSDTVFYRLRDTGGSGLANAASVLESDEIRSDRGIAVSRKGTNAPDAEANFELSWQSFDHLLQGALGGEWQGGITFDSAAEGVTVTVDTAGVFSIPGYWNDYGIYEGDYILVEGTLNDNIIAQVDSIVWNAGTTADDMTLVDLTGGALATSSATEAVVLTTGHYAQEVTGVSVVDTAGEFTIEAAAGTWTTLGVRPGDKLWFNGFTGGSQEQWINVITVEDTPGVLEVEATGTNTLTAEAATTVTVITNTGFLTVGTNLDYFTYAENFADVTTGNDVDGNAIGTDGATHWSVGNRIASMSLSIQVDSLITGSFSLQGMTYSGFKTSPIYGQDGNSVKEPNANQVFDSFTGQLIVPSAPAVEGVVTGLNFDIDNGTERKFVLMERDAMAIGEGRSNISGTMDAFFSNPDVSNLFENEDEFEVFIRMEDLDTNSYAFVWPRCKLESDSRSVSENDVTSSFGIRMLYGGHDKIHTMAVLRQPAVE